MDLIKAFFALWPYSSERDLESLVKTCDYRYFEKRANIVFFPWQKIHK